jgi:hypothetical protein
MNNEIVEKYINNYGIKSIVVATSIVDNKCRISLRGGYSIVLEVIDRSLYKDGEYFCLLTRL